MVAEDTVKADLWVYPLSLLSELYNKAQQVWVGYFLLKGCDQGSVSYVNTVLGLMAPLVIINPMHFS